MKRTAFRIAAVLIAVACAVLVVELIANAYLLARPRPDDVPRPDAARLRLITST
jgi:hypothetical protein